MQSTITIICIFAVLALFAIEVILGQIRAYKRAPMQKKLAIKKANHDAALKAKDLIESSAKAAVLTAAKNEHLNSGAAKKAAAVKFILKVLKFYGFDNVSVLQVQIAVEAAYQAAKDFIAKHDLDSRNHTTPSPDNLDSNQASALVNGNSTIVARPQSK